MSKGFFRRLSQKFGVRILALLLPGLLLVFSGLGYLSLRLHRRDLEAAAVLSADRVGDVLKRSTAYYMLRNDREGLYHIINTMGNEPGMVRVRIFNQEGRVSFSTDPREVNQYVDKGAEACYGCHAQAQPLTRLDRPDRFRIYHAGGERVLGIITPIANSPTCSDAPCHAHPAEQHILGVLDTNLSLAAADANLAAGSRQILITGIIGVLAITLMTGIFVWNFVHKRVSALRRATEKLAAGELGYQIESHSRDELGDLANSFNQMSRQLLEAREEITAWTRTLESRVEEKTGELKRANEQVLQAEKLASLGKMSAVVAHEINNPLSGILTYARLVRKWLEQGDALETRAGEMKESLQLIESESRRCGDIVKHLLTFARAAPLNLQGVDINAVIRRCVRLVGHKAERAGITVDLELAGDGPRVFADAAQIEQLLLALTMNAIEAMPRGGRLRFQTGEAAGGSEVHILVEDDGVGIPAEVLPRLFEPFVTAREDGHGVGLGLAISKSIVDRHRGRIEVRSEPGRGTAFTITLPSEVAIGRQGTDPHR